jgi:signal transduction histidine kinase
MEVSRLIRALTLRYVLALLLVGSLATAGQGLLHWLLVGQEQAATVVNLAGRQRMLSQRIVQLSLRGEAAAVDAHLDEWETAHRALLGTAPDGNVNQANSEEVMELFAEIEHALNGMTAAARAGDLARLLSLETGFLEVMDQIVSQYESEHRSQVQRLRLVAVTTLLALLLLLCAEVFFVFRPAVARLSTTLRRQQATESALAELMDLERMQMGQELHDGLAPNLAGIAMLLRSNAPPSLAAEKLDDVLAQLRTLMTGLDPSPRLALGLDKALYELGHELSALHGIEVVVTVDLETEVGGDTAAQLHRIAQEAARNSARHSGAKQIVIELTGTATTQTLRVEDSGCGFDTAEVPSDGMGLRIMESRARRIGATLKLDSSVGGGCRVVCQRTEHTL